MLAKLVRKLPEGEGWQFEPKWDGFRSLSFRDGDTLAIQSRAGQPLGRYFPEMVEALLALAPRKFVLDGEIVIPREGGYSFEELQLRIHPAESRVKKLAAEIPAQLFVFDLLVDEKGESLLRLPLLERRARLEALASSFGGRVQLCRATRDRAALPAWEAELRGNGIDGLIAKRVEAAYLPGDRSAMQKFKWIRTADCVVGGFRYASTDKIVGSLLLGLHDDSGLLHHVGFSSNMKKPDRKALTPRLEAMRKPPGFSGHAPGGPSRWSTERSGEWEPVDPVLVCEVEYDHFSGGRFRHGCKFLRWRDDKRPDQCTFDQLVVDKKGDPEPDDADDIP
jgi:ATP-dependent DNA ligase